MERNRFNAKSVLILFVLPIFISSCASRTGQAPDSAQQTANSGLVKTNRNYSEIKVGSSPMSPLVADFDNDGFNDFAVVSHGESQLMIFWGRANDRFEKGPVYGKNQVGYHPGKIDLIDWNKDGLTDIILACEGIFEVQYWQNTGKGFEKKATVKVPINAVSIKCADLDNDGMVDIVLGPHQGNHIVVLWGKKGIFSFDPKSLKTNDWVQNVEVDDWNGDGKPDIFCVEKVPGSAAAFLNGGDRKFSKRYIKQPGKPNGIVKDGPAYVKLADLDGDGCKDAAVTLEVGKACMIYYGDCTGGVKREERIPAPEWGFTGLAATGRTDRNPPMLALGEEMKLFIAKKMDARWTTLQKPAGSLPEDFSFKDINNDGELDLIFSNTAGTTVGILWGPF